MIIIKPTAKNKLFYGAGQGDGGVRSTVNKKPGKRNSVLNKKMIALPKQSAAK